MERLLKDQQFEPLEKLCLKPFIFNNMRITVMNALKFCHKSDWKAAEHSHLCFELSSVSSGSFVTVYNGKEFVTSAGEAHLISPYTTHSNKKMSPGVNYGVCVRFSLEQTANDGETLSFLCYESFMRQLTELCGKPFVFNGEAHFEKFAEFGQRELSLQMAFVDFLITLTDCEERMLYQGTGSSGADDNEILVGQAIHYIQSYKGSGFNVQQMVDSLYVSYRHLARIFKKITGKSILQYYNDIRIERVKKLLAVQDITMKQIMAESGFESRHYLQTLFRKSVGKTPAEYRKTIGQDASLFEY